jgi:hypothetical protein
MRLLNEQSELLRSFDLIELLSVSHEFFVHWPAESTSSRSRISSAAQSWSDMRNNEYNRKNNEYNCVGSAGYIASDLY